MILFLGWSSVSAQLDIVYLEGGGIMRGYILAEVPGEGITINTDEGELLIVKQVDIIRIARVKAIEGYWDVLYLKPNGRKEGFITKYQWGESLTLSTLSGDNIKLGMHEIRKIERVQTPDDESYEESVRLAGKSREPVNWSLGGGYGFYFIEYGLQLALTKDNRMAAGFFLNQVLGYRVENRFSMGLGLGLDWLWFNNSISFPGRNIFFDGRIFFPLKGIMPYTFFDAGYDWLRRGSFINPGLGARFSLFERFSLNLALDIKLQQVDTDQAQNARLSPLLRIIQVRVVFD